MGDSAIEWTDWTWNPVTGCTKVSQGCKHCYAERLWPKVEGARVAREGGEPRPFTVVACHPERLDQPLRMRRPRRIFVNSMSDLFHEDVPDTFIERVFAVMARAQQHTFQVLTKRADRMLNWFMYRALVTTGDELYEAARSRWPAPNVWLGVSVEDQAEADERIPLLLQTPASVRWISAEPLLGPVDLTSVAWPNKISHRVDVLRGGYWNRSGYIGLGPSAELGEARGGFTNHSDMHKVDWVVAGGESGEKARAAYPAWFRSLRDQCAAAGVPFLFKQWGAWAPQFKGDGFPISEHHVVRIGKKAAGRALDGRLHDEYPT